MKRLMPFALVLAGCATVPAPPRPAASQSAQGAFVESRHGGVSQAPLPASWWRLFNDPVLDGHVQRALGVNSELRVALANLEVARAAVRQASAARNIRAGVESGRGSTSAVCA